MKKKKLAVQNKTKDVAWIINSLPKKYRARAFSLMRYITRNYNMKWDVNGTFKYKGQLIPNSNIIHLVLHALLKTVKDKPPGMNRFYKGLSEVNVPEFLVSNEMGKLILMGRGNEINNTKILKKKRISKKKKK